MICCPEGITPNSGLTGPNNTHTYIYIYIYIYRERERARGLVGCKGTKHEFHGAYSIFSDWYGLFKMTSEFQ